GPSNGGGGGGGSNSGAGGGAGGPGGRASGQDGPAGSSSGPAAQHQCQGGHPVDLVTGNVVDEADDLALFGRIKLDFKRFYSSARYQDRASSLGPGWAHGLDQRIEVGERVISLFDAEGRWIRFEPIAVGASTFHRRERRTLHREGELDFRVEDHERKLVHRFRPMSPGGAAMLQSTEDGYGNAVGYVYETGRLVAVQDSAGRTVHVRWRGSRIVRLEVSVAGSVEQWVDYEYDGSGRLAAVVDALGHAEEYEYDAYGRMLGATTKTGARFQYAYDPNSGRCIHTWGPKGLYDIRLEYDFENRLTRVEGEEGRIIEWDELVGFARTERLLDGTLLEETARDADGYLIARTNGAGEGTKHWYDARGNEVRRVDAMGRVTAWEYDDRDNPIRRIDPNGLVTEYAHDPHGSVLSVAYPTGKRAALTYDDLGRLVRVQETSGTKTAVDTRLVEYDAQHNVVAVTNARGVRTTYTYDGLGRPLSETENGQRTTHLARDRMGRPTTLRFGDGSTVQRTYDAAGRITREVDPSGAVTELSWQGMGKLARLVDANGRTWRLEYTGQERLAKVTNPLGEAYEYAYDEAGQVIETKSFDARKTVIFRGASGRVERVEQPDGTWRAYEYDRAGALTGESASDGSSVSVRRDAMGLVIEATLTEKGASGQATRQSTHFERDPFGRITLERQGDRVLRFGHDIDGRTVERTLFDGSTTTWGFDGSGYLASAAHRTAGGAAASFVFERDALGRELKRADARGNVSVHQAFDLADRLLEQRATGPAGEAGIPDVLAQRQYQYDRSGRVTRVDDAIWGKSTYRYDAAGRLEEALSPNDHRQVFAYDPASSLVSILEGIGGQAAGAQKSRWKVAAGNRLTETERHVYTFDKRARRTAKRDKKSGEVTDYVWDVRDRLREIRLPDGTRVTMEYDAFGRRTRKEVTGKGRAKVTELLWHGDQLCAELTPEAGVRAFVHHPNGGAPLLQAERNEVLLVVTDHHGVPKELIDGAGRVAWAAAHDPWGRIIAERWDPIGEQNRGYRVRSPFRLLGQYDDEGLGLTMTRFRYFDPEVGRWCSPDPLGLTGGLNLHGFDGAPTVVVDPLGLSTDSGHPHPPVDPVQAVQDETLANRGNFGSAHTLTPEQALTAGAEFVGPGYREMGGSGTGVFRSADGTRQFRIDDGSITGAHGDVGSHVHLETLDPNRRGRDATISNNHIPISA
ncbi:MAG: RHS repeat protein, partial [Polyangiaceae bacterium]|nr:RHS repeat protein [Polyangiaceae bacterium]